MAAVSAGKIDLKLDSDDTIDTVRSRVSDSLCYTPEFTTFLNVLHAALLRVGHVLGLLRLLHALFQVLLHVQQTKDTQLPRL